MKNVITICVLFMFLFYLVQLAHVQTKEVQTYFKLTFDIRSELLFC